MPSIKFSKTLLSAAKPAGFDAPYVPGWDCHGLPIEVMVEKLHGKDMPKARFRELCREYAAEQIARQKKTLSAWVCWAIGTILT